MENVLYISPNISVLRYLVLRCKIMIIFMESRSTLQLVRQKLNSLPFFTVKVEFAITVVQIAFSNTGEQNKASL